MYIKCKRGNAVVRGPDTADPNGTLCRYSDTGVVESVMASEDTGYENWQVEGLDKQDIFLRFRKGSLLTNIAFAKCLYIFDVFDTIKKRFRIEKNRKYFLRINEG